MHISQNSRRSFNESKTQSYSVACFRFDSGCDACQYVSADVLATGAILSGSPLKSGSQVFAGRGSADDPYHITSADDWNALSNHINGGCEEYCKKSLAISLGLSKDKAIGYINQLFCEPAYKARLLSIASEEQ